MKFKEKLFDLVNKELNKHIEEDIIPLYDNFDKAHNRKHVQKVIRASLKLANSMDKDLDIIYAAAAYHDLGLGYLNRKPIKNREKHHIYSQEIVEQEAKLREFFSPEEIKIIGQACHDHRASLEGEPESIYGKIIADADRMDALEIEDMIIRCWDYTVSLDKDISLDKRYKNIYSHLVEKYGYQGYAYKSFYLKESKELLREVIKNSQEIISSERDFKELFYKLKEEGRLNF